MAGYELNHLNKGFAVRDATNQDRLVAIGGGDVSVHFEGATVKTTKILLPSTADDVVCESTGSVQAGATLQLGTDATETMTVNSIDVSANTINITSTGGVTLTAGDRLVVASPTPSLYSDELGVTAASVDNTLTADNDGRISAYVYLTECDIIIEEASLISGDGKLLFKDQAVPPARRYTNREMLILPDASDITDALNKAIEFIVARGGGILDIEGGDFTISDEIIHSGKVIIRGQGRDVTRIITADGTINMFVDDASANSFLGFQDLTLKHAASATGDICDYTGATINNFDALRVKFENGLNQLNIDELSDGRIVACDFVGESAVSANGLRLHQPVRGVDVNGCSFTGFTIVSQQALTIADTAGAGTKGNTTIRGCHFKTGIGKAINLNGADATNKLVNIAISGIVVDSYATGINAAFVDNLRVGGDCIFPGTASPINIDTHTRDNGYGGFWYDDELGSYPVPLIVSGAPTDTPDIAAVAFDYTNNRLYVYNHSGTPAWKFVAVT